MVEELRSAIVNLVKDRPQVSISTLKSLVECHRVFLKENNTNGFFWSFKFLQGVTRTWYPVTPDGLNKLFNDLFTTPRSDEDVEDSYALAALVVGTQAFFGGKYELAVEWLEKSHAAAKTVLFKRELVFQLAIAFARQNKLEDALHWLAVAKEHTESEPSLQAPVIFIMGFFSAVEGNFDSARNCLALLRGDEVSPSFSSALAAMLEVECKYFESSSVRTSLQLLIAGYSEARKLLIRSCMPNLEMELAKFIGASDICPQNVFFKVLTSHLDGFSQLLISDVIPLEDSEPGFPVSNFFFAYDLYRSSRKRMIQLQEKKTDKVASFMDPRPHMEEALDGFRNKKIDLPPIVMAHQVSLKAGDFTCFLLAGELLAVLRGGGMETGQLFASLRKAFGDKCTDEEDPEAWAAYHIGHSSWIPGLLKFSGMKAPASARYSFLEKSLNLARTPTLKSLAAVSLYTESEELSKKLDLLEVSKDKAVEAGHEDLIIQASYLLFTELCDSRRYEKMFNLIEQLRIVVAGKFSSSSCLGALIKHMEGMLNLCVDQIVPDKNHGYEQLERCLALLPRNITKEDLHWRYFTNREDSWSTMRNHYMSHMKQVSLDLLNQYYYQYQQELPRSPDAELLLYHLEGLIETYKLEEAEVIGAELLGTLEEDDQLLAYVLLFLVQLTGRYFKRDHRSGQNGGTDMECVRRNLSQIMVSFVEAALAIAMDTNAPHLVSEAYWYHSIGLDLLGEGLKCLNKMEQSLTVLMQEDVNFGTFSDGRIKYMDRFLSRFQVLQLALMQLGEIGEEVQGTLRSLVWSERHRSRDFMFKLRSANKEMYLRNLAAFDSDDDKALEEIMDALKMPGHKTVVLVINQLHREEEGDWIFLVYFLHLSKTIVRRQAFRTQDWVFVTEELQQLVRTTEDCFSDDTFRSYFEALHQVLVEPFTAELEEVEANKIIFVPSKEMSTIPFSLLLDKSRDEFLIQQYAISVTSSLRLLKHCEVRRLELMASRSSSGCSTSLVVGDPTNDLRAASREAHTVAGFLNSKCGCSVTELHHGSATKEAVLQELPQSDWIHVASHCMVSQEFPDGALLLASAFDRKTTGVRRRYCEETEGRK